MKTQAHQVQPKTFKPSHILPLILDYFQRNYKLGLVLFAGVLMGLAAEPIGFWLLAWVALVPLWLVVLQSKTSKTSTLPFAIAWGMGYHGTVLFWITGVHPMTWLGVPWLASLAIALFCWIFITFWGVGLVITWAKILSIVSRQIPSQNLNHLLTRVLVGTALWCGLEWFWSQGSLWWSSLSLTQSFGNLVILHLGRISGPNTVTAALVAVNGLIAEAWLINRTKNKIETRTKTIIYSLPILCFSLAHLVGFYLYIQPLKTNPETALKIGIIQGNIPNKIKLYSEGWRQALQGYTTGYRTLADQGVDAVLTPETALPFLWKTPARYQSSFYQAILEKKVVAWVGSYGQEGNRISNSLFTVDGEGNIISQYNKVNLVPLGEYIPFESILGRFINRLSPLDSHLVKGDPSQQFKTTWGQAIVGICYDSTFARHFRRQAKTGGEFILTASNNSHYSAGMLAQHHAQDVMRAIETDRWAIRATNTGYSGVVDPHGKTLWRSQMDTYELHIGTIQPQQTQTLYVRWGDWFTLVLLILSIIAIAINLVFKTIFGVSD
ncbi:apolipoprotein N-acyltransferase [Lyngbya sp. PCC 8106]|uniref:apolipoprotein N-acyltransferase n=1 Tax=Lyngbya sp. (strain PCC 8106) TaxID=313612 RepID=UPI0000EA9055|nr:apolipoprotein N-acyltransferase [Lyngbya sp. PCC 8106]